jgi:hypothetical protein
MRSTERVKADPVSRQARSVDPDALLCALVLAPKTYARNKFFRLFEVPELARIRRRAARVRGIIRQVGGQPDAAGQVPAGQIIGEQVFDDRVLLRYTVDSVRFARTTALTPLEAALVHYALHTATGAELAPGDRELVRLTLSRLADDLGPVADSDPAEGDA